MRQLFLFADDAARERLHAAIDAAATLAAEELRAQCEFERRSIGQRFRWLRYHLLGDRHAIQASTE